MLAPINPCEIAINAQNLFNEFIEERLNYTDFDWKRLWYLWNKQWNVFLLDDISAIIKRHKERDSKESIKHFVYSQDEENILLPNRMLLLNFNYTTIADIYLSWDKNKHHQINHIHGELNNPNGMIFGYGDELDDCYKDILRLNDNEYLREIKSVKYLETDNYRKMLSFIESEPYQVYIMGHSCGNSDRTLLNTLFEHKNCVSIKPFYHKKDNGSDNYLDIIQNISRNFTDMKLMRDRVVSKQYCIPLPQLSYHYK